MKKMLIVYNFAQKYRTAIFKAIDENWECKWIFGKNTTDIKGMDTSCLKNVEYVDNKKCFGPFWKQSKVADEASKDEYNTLLMLGEPFNLSTWWIMIRNRFSKNRKNIYLWSHGWYGRENFAKKWMKRIFFGLADKTFLYGNYAKEMAIKQGFPEEKLEVIHNSLDHANQIKLRESLSKSNIYKSHFGNENPVIIFIGRLTAVKRIDLLIEAIAKLKEQGKLFNVTLIGDGEKRKELEGLVYDRGLEKQVWFYGACYDDNQNAQLIYDADLCVAPGNVGLTAMHTMVFGTPVLTHNNFPMQMPEFEAIIPGKTGDFFEYNNISSLADKIESSTTCNKLDRDLIRKECYHEIDSYWTPDFQMRILKSTLE